MLHVTCSFGQTPRSPVLRFSRLLLLLRTFWSLLADNGHLVIWFSFSTEDRSQITGMGNAEKGKEWDKREEEESQCS